jgi:YggT family protein
LTSPYISHPLYGLGELYLLILMLRAVFSWFPISPGGAMASVSRFLYSVTEPVLAPVRRMVPPLGMFDMSFLVVIAVVWVLTRFVLYRILAI